MSVKSRGRDESLIICEMKQYIYTYYRSFLHWLALLSLSETSNPHHGVPHGHSLLRRHGLTYRSEKNFVWFICTDHVLAPKIISHGSAWRGQGGLTNVKLFFEGFPRWTSGSINNGTFSLSSADDCLERKETVSSAVPFQLQDEPCLKTCMHGMLGWLAIYRDGIETPDETIVSIRLEVFWINYLSSYGLPSIFWIFIVPTLFLPTKSCLISKKNCENNIHNMTFNSWSYHESTLVWVMTFIWRRQRYPLTLNLRRRPMTVMILTSRMY